MPAEWEPHEATWLTWPQNEETWPGKLRGMSEVWVEIVNAVLPGERVHILVDDADVAAHVEERLRHAELWSPRVSLHTVPTNDAWTRDQGPTFVIRESDEGAESAVVDWVFNAWGEKYPPWEKDAAVKARIAEMLGLRRFEPGIVLEGGSIEVNGKGTLLTTESCLLNRNRNPHLNKAQLEGLLCDYLGVREVLWLGAGIVGDDTDGHIDDIARFVDPCTVLAACEEDPEDENYEPLRENMARLMRMRDPDGRTLRVVALPMPEPVFAGPARLPASYANFYIANRAVLVPTFGQKRDALALEILQGSFPGRQVVGIESTDLVRGLGAVHCVTQQQPRVGAG